MADQVDEQLAAQRALIERLAAMLEEQGRVIGRQQEQLDRLLGGPGPDRVAVEPVVAPSGRGDGSVAAEGATDRRHLLSRAATAAAGAVVGGAALALGQASPVAAAQGIFDGNPGVLGVANPNSANGVAGQTATGNGVFGLASGAGVGVYGTASNGTGVRGDTSGGIAVRGNATGGIGAYGQATTGTGVGGASSTGVAVQALTDTGTQLQLSGGPMSPPSSTVSRTVGSVVKDANNDVWYCTVGGAPGAWRKVTGPSTAGAFHALKVPKRVYDSRPGQAPVGVGPKTPLAASTARTVDLKENSSGVPVGATAVLVNLIATGTTSAVGGFMSIYANGIAFPGTSNLNWSGAGQTIAVTTVTAVDEQARCAVYAGSVTDVVVDVLGYYR